MIDNVDKLNRFYLFAYKCHSVVRVENVCERGSSSATEYVFDSYIKAAVFARRNSLRCIHNLFLKCFLMNHYLLSVII